MYYLHQRSANPVSHLNSEQSNTLQDVSRIQSDFGLRSGWVIDTNLSHILYELVASDLNGHFFSNENWLGNSLSYTKDWQLILRQWARLQVFTLARDEGVRQPSTDCALLVSFITARISTREMKSRAACHYDGFSQTYCRCLLDIAETLPVAHELLLLLGGFLLRQLSPFPGCLCYS